MHLSIVPRAGFTLAELVVTLALLGLVVTLLLNTLASHQKVFRSIGQRILVSEQLRDGQLALAGDIRAAAIRADTLRMISDSAFEFLASIGSSVTCRVNGQVVSLVPASLSSGLMLSSLPFPPDTGDLFAAYSQPDSISGVRRWVKFRISAVSPATATSCDASNGFTGSADAGSQTYRITLVGSTDAIASGASVRILRRGRYSLYRATDGAWYLGYKRCNAVATGCSTIQPVSGPYLAHSSAGGVQFRYLDSLGSLVPSSRPLDVAAIEITLRASHAGAITAVDSAIALVSFRNIH